MKRLELFKPLYPFQITQGFGQNLVPIYKEWGLLGHSGIDVVCGYLNGKYYETRGAEIRAAHDGEVTYSGMDSNEGYGVVIKTNEQFLDVNSQPQYWKLIYWHLNKNILVRVGQKVLVGDIIGYADSTGTILSTTGPSGSGKPHLHFGLKPIAQGENEWTWDNVLQNNGYRGAVDSMPYMSTMSAYQLRGSLQLIAEQIKKLAELISLFIRR